VHTEEEPSCGSAEVCEELLSALKELIELLEQEYSHNSMQERLSLAN
jgi:hypothetical protein